MRRRSPACHFLAVLGLSLGLLFVLAFLNQQWESQLERLLISSTSGPAAGSLLMNQPEPAEIPLAEPAPVNDPASPESPASAERSASAESPATAESLTETDSLTTAVSAEAVASQEATTSPTPVASLETAASQEPAASATSAASPTPAVSPAPPASTTAATTRKPITARTASPTTSPPAPTGIAQATVSTGSSGRLIVPFYYVGEKIGTIRIPSVGISVIVYQGDSPDILEKGAGHYTGSFLPGQGGNIVIAGHRVQSVFRNFEYLRPGATVSFNTTYGNYSYRVIAFRVIDDEDESIVRETSREQLTLYTCYPFDYIGTAPQRYVVICERA